VPRPRDDSLDERIIAAAEDLLRDVGFARFSLTEVARRAGVGKPAVYRRFADKADLIMALTVDAGTPQQIDTGSFAGDIRAAVEQLARSLDASSREIVAAQLAVVISDPAAARRFEVRDITPANEAIMRLWDRGVERGEVRAELDGIQSITALSGAVIHAVLHLHQPPAGPWLEQLLDTYLRGVRP
jgi:AcrR family transcriptional regulator